MWSKYGKAVASVFAALLAVIASVTSGDGHISDEEKFQIAIAVATAISVYLVPAVPEWPWMKTAVAALLAGLVAASSLVVDGWSINDTVNVLIAVVGVILVALSPTDTVQRHVSTQNPRL
jgi:hypothetical protein